MDNASDKLLYVLSNDMVFMMVVNQTETPFGCGIQKLFYSLRSIVGILRLAFCGDNQLTTILEEPAYADPDSFNQDTIRDNFSAITLLIDSAFDGTSCPGGAIPNMLIGSQNGPQVLLEMMRKGTKQYGKA